MIYLDTSVVLLILLEQEGASSAKAFFERLEPAERVLSSEPSIARACRWTSPRNSSMESRPWISTTPSLSGPAP